MSGSEAADDARRLAAFVEMFGRHRDQKGQRLRDQWLAWYGIWCMAWKEAQRPSPPVVTDAPPAPRFAAPIEDDPSSRPDWMACDQCGGSGYTPDYDEENDPDNSDACERCNGDGGWTVSAPAPGDAEGEG